MEEKGLEEKRKGEDTEREEEKGVKGTGREFNGGEGMENRREKRLRAGRVSMERGHKQRKQLRLWWG